MLGIQSATKADVGTILRFIQGLADYEDLSSACVATEADLERTLFGEDPAAQVLLARDGDVAVGFALFFRSYSTFLAQPGIYLEDLFVDPDHRHRGVGTALLQRLAQLATERDYGRVEWSVLDWNEPAIAFYRGIGAVPLDEWTGFRLTGDALTNFANR